MRKRARIQIKQAEGGGWYPVVVDQRARELERGPVSKTEAEAREHRDNYRRFGAWKRS